MITFLTVPKYILQVWRCFSSLWRFHFYTAMYNKCRRRKNPHFKKCQRWRNFIVSYYTELKVLVEDERCLQWSVSSQHSIEILKYWSREYCSRPCWGNHNTYCSYQVMSINMLSHFRDVRFLNCDGEHRRGHMWPSPVGCCSSCCGWNLWPVISAIPQGTDRDMFTIDNPGAAEENQKLTFVIFDDHRLISSIYFMLIFFPCTALSHHIHILPFKVFWVYSLLKNHWWNKYISFNASLIGEKIHTKAPFSVATRLTLPTEVHPSNSWANEG